MRSGSVAWTGGTEGPVGFAHHQQAIAYRHEQGEPLLASCSLCAVPETNTKQLVDELV